MRNCNVVIAGPAAIGKSDLAIQISQRLPQSTYLPLDACVLPTDDRDSRGIDGCQVGAYDFSQAQRWLDQLEQGESFQVSPYDHSLRLCAGSLVVDGRQHYRLIEWVFGLSDRIQLRRDVVIVLDGDLSAKHTYWMERLTTIRGNQLSESSVAAVVKRLASTERDIVPTLVGYHIRFTLDARREIQSIECRDEALSRMLQRELLVAGQVG